jgi:hypothetical protein
VSVTGARRTAASAARVDDVDEARGIPSRRWWWLRGPGAAAGIFVLIRLGSLGLIGVLAQIQHKPVRELLLYWDGTWYVRVAQYGYPAHVAPGHGNAAQNGLGFFPALPIAIRAVHALTRLDWPVAGLVASGLAGLVGSMLLWRLLRDLEGRGALRGTLLVLLSPGAFVLSLVYGEGLLIAAVSGCLLSLRRRRWVLAGLLGAVASATDPLGAAIVLPCLLASVVALRRSRDRLSVAAPLLAGAGIAGFFGYLWLHTGSPFAWFEAQRHGWQHGGFGAGIPSVFASVWNNAFGEIDASVKAASTVLTVGLLVALWLWRRRRVDPFVAAYVFGVLALAVASPIVAFSPRVLLRAFPLVGLVGTRLGRWQAWVCCGLFAAAMVAMTVGALALGATITP